MWSRRKPADDWRPCTKVFRVRSITGRMISGAVMYCVVGGEIRYREMTETEEEDWRDCVQAY